MRGRPPKPKRIKVLEGNRGHRPAPKARKSNPKARGPICPAWLSTDAKAEWKRIVPSLVKRGIVCDLDRAVLAGYCEMFSILLNANRTIERDGATFKVGKLFKRHPAVAIAAAAAKDVAALARDLGLTPVTRLRFEHIRAPEEDDLDRLLNDNR